MISSRFKVKCINKLIFSALVWSVKLLKDCTKITFLHFLTIFSVCVCLHLWGTTPIPMLRAQHDSRCSTFGGCTLSDICSSHKRTERREARFKWTCVCRNPSPCCTYERRTKKKDRSKQRLVTLYPLRSEFYCVVCVSVLEQKRIPLRGREFTFA